MCTIVESFRVRLQGPGSRSATERWGVDDLLKRFESIDTARTFLSEFFSDRTDDTTIADGIDNLDCKQLGQLREVVEEICDNNKCLESNDENNHCSEKKESVDSHKNEAKTWHVDGRCFLRWLKSTPLYEPLCKCFRLFFYVANFRPHNTLTRKLNAQAPISTSSQSASKTKQLNEKTDFCKIGEMLRNSALAETGCKPEFTVCRTPGDGNCTLYSLAILEFIHRNNDKSLNDLSWADARCVNSRADELRKCFEGKSESTEGPMDRFGTCISLFDCWRCAETVGFPIPCMTLYGGASIQCIVHERDGNIVPGLMNDGYCDEEGIRAFWTAVKEVGGFIMLDSNTHHTRYVGCTFTEVPTDENDSKEVGDQRTQTTLRDDVADDPQ